MADKLHILNGDSTLHLFQETGIAGDRMVWNEILCEGPVSYEVATQQFWDIRLDFLTETFGPGASNYRQLIEAFESVRQLENYEEIILWYEYDLFCQINLVALLSWFYKNNAIDKTKLSLICAGQEPGFDRLVGLGQIPVGRYNELYDGRTTLSEASLAYADEVWMAYASQDAKNLEFAMMPHPVFTYLSAAITSHFRRFPYVENQLSEIESQILNFIDRQAPENVDQVVRYMLQREDHYGFGDLQYFHYLKLMEDLIDFQKPLQLSNLGKKALAGDFDRKSCPKLKFNLGGALTNDFQWNEAQQTLV